MRTLFLLDRQDLADLRSGKPFDLRVGDAIITLQAETPTRRTPAEPPTPAKTRRVHTPAFKRQVVTYARRHTKAEASRKFQVVASVVSRWIKEMAA